VSSCCCAFSFIIVIGNTGKRSWIGFQIVIAIVFQTLYRIVTVGRIVISFIRLLEIVPCHRIKSRSLTIKGNTLPLCARCTGILLGYFLFPLLLAAELHFPLWLGILFNIPMVADGGTQKLKFRMSNNFLRLATGFLSGFGQSIIIVSVSHYMISFLLTK
jgi:uncharacterized membrane protein